MSFISHRHWVKKSIVFFTLLCITFTPMAPAPLLKPQPAEASASLVKVIGGIGTIQETITAAMTSSLQLKEYALDPIAYAIGKQLLNRITASIIDWINSGFEGKPAFVTDLGGLLQDAASQAVGEYIANDPGLSFLCSPFELDVKFALATSYQEFSSPGGGKSEAAACTLDDVTGNIENFLGGAFEEGGWDGWFEVTQKPGNTPDGAFLAAEAEMYARIVNAQGETLTELDWGDGVQSLKFCSDGSLGSGSAAKDCIITSPGALIKNEMLESMGVTRESLQQIDEFNEIIPAIAVALVDAAMKKGFLALGSALSGGSGSLSNRYASQVGAEGTTDADGNYSLDCTGDDCRGFTELLWAADIPSNLDTATNALSQKRAHLKEYQALLNEVIEKYESVENKLISAQIATPNCSLINDYEIGGDLKTAIDRAREDSADVDALVTELQTWEIQLQSVTSPDARLEILSEFASSATGETYTKYEGPRFGEAEEYVDAKLDLDVSAESDQIDEIFTLCASSAFLPTAIANVEDILADPDNGLSPGVVAELENRLSEMEIILDGLDND